MEPSDILRRVRRIEFRTRRAVNEFAPGAYLSLFRGRGLEFAEIRAFQAGDDARTVDWRATARLGRPVVKQFLEERELNLMLLVDGSASCRCGGVWRRLLELFAIFAFSALRNRDRVGAMLFTSRQELVLPPDRGRHQAHRLLRMLLVHPPQESGTDLGAALDAARRGARRGTVFVVLSDFLDPAFDGAIRRSCLRHDVVAVRIHSRAIHSPPGRLWLSLADAESGTVTTLDTGGISGALAQAADERGERLDQRLRNAGAEVLAIDEGRDPVPLLARFLARRENGRTSPGSRRRRQ